MSQQTIHWNCNLSKNANITVGEVLNLTCDGPTDGVAKESLQIKDVNLSDEMTPLSLLQTTTFDSSKSEFVVTSYKTGEHQSDQIIFFDGKNKIDLSGFNWKVESVLKQDPANPPQPYGAYPMAFISYPLWLWIALALILAAMVGIPYLQLKRIKARRKAFADLKNLDTALNPLDAFFKSVRRMEKALEIEHVSPRGFADQIDTDLKIFLSRSLLFPAHIWSIRETINEIKRKYPKLYRDHGDEIKKYFSEFTKSKSEINKKDALYLMERAQKLTETIEKSISKKRGPR
jgi:hypothetical protein